MTRLQELEQRRISEVEKKQQLAEERKRLRDAQRQEREREQEEIDMKYASVRKLIRKGTKIILDFTRKEELRR